MEGVSAEGAVRVGKEIKGKENPSLYWGHLLGIKDMKAGSTLRERVPADRVWNAVAQGREQAKLGHPVRFPGP